MKTIQIREEDYDFLRNLQRTLLNQSHDETASPRVWGIMEDKEVCGLDPEHASHLKVWDGEIAEYVGEPDNMQSVISELVQTYKYPADIFDSCCDMEDVVCAANEHRHSVDGCSPFDLCGYNVESQLVRGKVFLTKAAAQDYIARYGYNHTNPRTYAMCAYRCPEYENLLRILETVELNG